MCIRDRVGALPLIRSIIERIRLREILQEYIPSSSRQRVPRADLLVLLVTNLTLAKDPLYELADWVRSLDLRALGYKGPTAGTLNDDCFGRVLDKLYEADPRCKRWSTVTSIGFPTALSLIHISEPTRPY